jgi:hypothetical protein
LKIPGVASVVLVRHCFRIDACRPHYPYSINNIIGSQPSSDDDGISHALHDLPVDLPAVGYPERTYLYVAEPMAVSKQHVGDSVVALCNGDAFVTDDRNASHHHDRGASPFELLHGRRRQQIGRRSKMHNGRF